MENLKTDLIATSVVAIVQTNRTTSHIAHGIHTVVIALLQ